MRSRLILAFILIALLSVVSVVPVFRQSAATQVRAYMFRGGMFGQQGLVTALGVLPGKPHLARRREYAAGPYAWAGPGIG
jgi:hypothetical protein